MGLFFCLIFFSGVSVYAVTEALDTTESGVKTSTETTADKIDSKDIQKALTEAGYYKGSIDGIVGKKTREAITKFQEANALKADGVCGPKTWEKLKAYLEEATEIDAVASASSETTSAGEETPAEEAAPTVDESNYDLGYSEFDSADHQDQNNELKQKLVS